MTILRLPEECGLLEIANSTSMLAWNEYFLTKYVSHALCLISLHHNVSLCPRKETFIENSIKCQSVFNFHRNVQSCKEKIDLYEDSMRVIVSKKLWKSELVPVEEVKQQISVYKILSIQQNLPAHVHIIWKLTSGELNA